MQRQVFFPISPKPCFFLRKFFSFVGFLWLLDDFGNIVSCITVRPLVDLYYLTKASIYQASALQMGCWTSYNCYHVIIKVFMMRLYLHLLWPGIWSMKLMFLCNPTKTLQHKYPKTYTFLFWPIAKTEIHVYDSQKQKFKANYYVNFIVQKIVITSTVVSMKGAIKFP